MGRISFTFAVHNTGSKRKSLESIKEMLCFRYLYRSVHIEGLSPQCKVLDFLAWLVMVTIVSRRNEQPGLFVLIEMICEVLEVLYISVTV